MGDNTRLKKGAWTSEEDERLSAYITTHGRCTWSKLPIYAGLNRCGKSCRLRWMNYLRPDLKRGSFTREEEKLILNLHDKFGTRRSRSIRMICFAISSWSKIAAGLPGRSDNEIKNYWHTHLKEKSRKIPRTKKAKSVPKPSRQDNVPFAILESSSETGVSLQEAQDSSPVVGNEVAIVKDPVDAIPWSELAELKIMLKAFDEYETLSKPDPECEHMDDIRSVLDFPVSPQTSDGLSPRSIDDFIMENLAAGEIVMLSALSHEHDRSDQFKIDEEVVIVKNQVTDETAITSELDWNYWNDEFMMEEGVPIVGSVDTNQMAMPSESYLEHDMNDQFKNNDEVVIVKNRITDETTISSQLDWDFWNDEFMMDEGVPVVESADTNQMAIPSEPYLELDPDYWNEFSLLYQSLGFTF